MNRQSRDWEKILEIHACKKDLYPKYVKNSYKSRVEDNNFLNKQQI